MAPNEDLPPARMSSGERITVVLVRPIYPRNIGMCARALANMGVQNLVLIAPQCELTEDAKQGATKAQKILREALVYPSLQAFYDVEGEGVRIALSGRGGRLRMPERLDHKLEILSKGLQPQILDPKTPLYLLFGPEDDGLNDEEIRLVNHVCALPTYGEFFSMNLSHATMLALYVVRSFLQKQLGEIIPTLPPPMQVTQEKSDEELRKEHLRAMRAPQYFPEKTLDSWLEVLGFELETRRVNAGRVLKRILLENEPTPDELRVLEAIIQQTVRKLRARES